MKKQRPENGQKRAGKARGLYTPKATQSHVIVASLAGKSKSEIARTVGLKRDTVARILSQPEVQELMVAYRQQVLSLVPLCLGALQEKLITKDGKLRGDVEWRMAIEILKGTQVLVAKQEQEVHEKKDEFDGRSERDLEFYLANGRFPDSIASEQMSGEEEAPGAGRSKTKPE